MGFPPLKYLFLFKTQQMKRILFFILPMLILTSCSNAQQDDLSVIKLPEGFKIEVFANDVKGARSLARGDKGTIFVGSRRDGNVYAIVDKNNDNKADKVYTIASGLDMPNGVALKDGNLYVAEISRIIRFDNIEANLENPPKPVVVSDKFPTDAHHGWKFIRFGPDGKLYVPVGAPCNICESEDERYASIMRMDPNGDNLEVYAHGVRNTVGFDWHPLTKELYFTDNGRDWFGENKPCDELNRAFKKGMHFGYPYCHQGDLTDPKYGVNKSCDDYTPPFQKLGPHVAGLGMRFYTGNMFPQNYKNQIFIAEHGSWNRINPLGYRITLVRLDGNKSLGYSTFAEGWLTKDGKIGRPVDVMQMPDGALLVSDDYSDRIYRISYKK